MSLTGHDKVLAELQEHLRVLSHGTGMADDDALRRMSPRLLALLRIPPATPGPQVRVLVVQRLDAAIASLDPETAALVSGGLALSPPARSEGVHNLSARVRALSCSLSMSESTVRRRLTSSWRILAGAILAGTPSTAHNPAHGWRVARLHAVMRLDSPLPRLEERRELLALGEPPFEITHSLSAPPLSSPGPGCDDLGLTVGTGATLIRLEQVSRSHWEATLRLSPPPGGGRVRYSVAWTVPTIEGLSPYCVAVPATDVDSFTAVVHVGTTAVLHDVWSVDGIQVSVLHDGGGAARRRVHPDDCGVFRYAREEPLEKGRAYGLAWTWGASPISRREAREEVHVAGLRSDFGRPAAGARSDREDERKTLVAHPDSHHCRVEENPSPRER